MNQAPQSQRKGVSPQTNAAYASKLARMIACKTVWTHEGTYTGEFQRFYTLLEELFPNLTARAKKLTFGGAVAGIAAGAVVDVLWLVLASSTGIYEIVPGFIAGLIAAVIASKLSKNGPGAEVEALFDRASQPEA